MLNSLHIEKYRLFKTLDIPELARVNLITGKNNVGKTALLEALRIWASEGESSVINNIIYERGDWGHREIVEDYATLFYNKEYKDAKGNIPMVIDENFLKIIIESESRNSGFVNTGNILIIDNRDGRKRSAFKMGENNYQTPRDKALFLSAWKETVELDKLWEDIALTPKEAVIIDMLQLINPEIIRLSVIDENAKVRLKNADQPVPLKNFGDGINWILKIALALANAENTLLLIDEVDSGLHYSVQEHLWELIFKYAEQLNVQVFATTHSRDCISAFAHVYHREENKKSGNYFRLQKKRGDNDIIVPVYYTDEDLEIALMQNIKTY